MKLIQCEIFKCRIFLHENFLIYGICTWACVYTIYIIVIELHVMNESVF